MRTTFDSTHIERVFSQSVKSKSVGGVMNLHLDVAHFDAGGRIARREQYGCGDQAANAECYGREEAKDILRAHQT